MSFSTQEYTNLIMFCISYFIALVSPGPSFLVIFKNSMLFSSKSGVFTAIGVVCGIVCQAFYILLFLEFNDNYYFLFKLIKIISSLYLIYLGISTFLNRNKAYNKKFNHENNTLSCYKSLKEGFLVDVLNPLSLSFFFGLFTIYIPNNACYLYKGTIWSLIFFIGACWFLPLTFLINQKKIRDSIQFLMSKNFSTFIAILFIYLGISLIFK